MSTFSEYQQAIVVGITERLPALKTVQTHGGSITEAELKRWGAVAPAVFVSVLGLRNPNTRLLDNVDVVFCLYVVTRDTPKAKRDVLALNLVQGLNQLLVGQRWQHEGFVSIPHSVDSQNLFNTELDRTGLSLWAITFAQTVELGAAVSLDDLDDFIRAHATYELGAEDSPVAEDCVILPTV